MEILPIVKAWAKSSKLDREHVGFSGRPRPSMDKMDRDPILEAG
jgi:hypothetical protein